MRVRVLLLWLFLTPAAMAQGFAGLGATADGFALPDPDRVLEFPADHGAHPGHDLVHGRKPLADDHRQLRALALAGGCELVERRGQQVGGRPGDVKAGQ
mgnify:CR=1 FL=1